MEKCPMSGPDGSYDLKVISYCLWGSNPKYNVGALKNADLAKNIYPGWICRFYAGSSVPREIIEQLKKRDNTDVVMMNQPGNWEAMLWRFYPAGEPEVDVMISRDVDSRLSLREKSAVLEWLESDKEFHIMRDHPAHMSYDNCQIILGGMWGAKRGCLPQMGELLGKFRKVDCYGIDQIFLATCIYPLIKNKCLVHDEFFSNKPFPIRRKDYDFIGQVFNEVDEPNLMYREQLERAVNPLSAKVPKISIITSLHKGGKFLAGYLENITKQTIFYNCELIIIDCNSPDNESELIKTYMKKHSNIIYRRLDYDPGIYGAWNIAVEMSSGELLTNANVDDRRAPDHIAVHARYLMDFPDIDLVYSRGYCTDEPNEPYEVSASKNTIFPSQREFNKENMAICLPGWSPLWRKSVHTRYGLFDETYKHSGDWEMWLRAVREGAKFLLIPGVYSCCYKNPEGKSTCTLYMSIINAENNKIFNKYKELFQKNRKTFLGRMISKTWSVFLQNRISKFLRTI